MLYTDSQLASTTGELSAPWLMPEPDGLFGGIPDLGSGSLKDLRLEDHDRSSCPDIRCRSSPGVERAGPILALAR